MLENSSHDAVVRITMILSSVFFLVATDIAVNHGAWLHVFTKFPC